jgi:hypothetical protein
MEENNMNKNDLYLIHEDDYIAHIDDKIALYLMLNQLTSMIARLPANRGNKALSDMADKFNYIGERMYATWDIPVRYLFTGDANALARLMARELAVPEDEDYFHCDGDCETCCPYEDEDEEDEGEYDDADDPARDEPDEATDKELEMFVDVLTQVAQALFGPDVKIH